MAEPNEVRGEFSVVLDDVELVLVPSFRRIQKAEGVLGRSLVRAAGELSDGLGLTVVEMVGVIEALLREPKLKRDELGEMIVKVGFVGVVPVLQEIFDRAVFGKEGDTEGNAEKGESSKE